MNIIHGTKNLDTMLEVQDARMNPVTMNVKCEYLPSSGGEYFSDNIHCSSSTYLFVNPVPEFHSNLLIIYPKSKGQVSCDDMNKHNSCDDFITSPLLDDFKERGEAKESEQGK